MIADNAKNNCQPVKGLDLSGKSLSIVPAIATTPNRPLRVWRCLMRQMMESPRPSVSSYRRAVSTGAEDLGAVKESRRSLA